MQQVERVECLGSDGRKYTVFKITPIARDATVNRTGYAMGASSYLLDGGDRVVSGAVPGTFLVLMTGVTLQPLTKSKDAEATLLDGRDPFGPGRSDHS